MSMMKNKPILMKGERLAVPTKKGSSGAEKTSPYTYEESKEKIINNINDIKMNIKENKNLFIESEIILCARMAEGFLAKSYAPNFLQKIENISMIGARKYNIKEKSEKSKLYFLKTDVSGLDKIEKILQNNQLNSTDIKNFTKIEKIDILNSEEKIFGFDESEKNLLQEENIEIVLHPLEKNIEKAIELVKNIVGNKIEVRKYEKGPIFILASVMKSKINNLADLNFLRTMHPLRNADIPETKNIDINGIPKINNSEKDCKEELIKIGVFDGGVISNNELLKGFVNKTELSTLPEEIKGLIHGTQVSSAVIHGPINDYLDSDIIPFPKVSVENFRVLPEKNIYVVIDNIEKVVEERHRDIKIYNISFGPSIPITDDEINRFTYSLDLLSKKYEVLFCVAVGNDGNVIEPFNRIQPPSDIVNGLGIGAYSKYEGKIYKADYSCVGLGREGAKIKPDLLAFGGDSRTPFHAASIDEGRRTLTSGTSFSSPVVAGRLGELLYLSEEINPLIARAIMIHNLEHKADNTKEEGFGILNKDVESMIYCKDSENEVTLIYEGSMFPKTYMKLPIPLPNLKGVDGKAELNWTIVSLTDVDGLDSDGYTNLCIEDKYHPNENVYAMHKNGCKPKKINIIKKYKEYKELIEEGYKKSKFQVNDGAKFYTEEEQRLDLKWDTSKKRYKNKMVSSIENPCIVLHCISRNNILDKISFCLVLTIKIKKYKANLYEDIMSEHPVLVPLDIREEVNVEV
ncbi:Subtilase family [Clostridioides difficile]|nr:Subtilase family [Clostridioides difficile]